MNIDRDALLKALSRYENKYSARDFKVSDVIHDIREIALNLQEPYDYDSGWIDPERALPSGEDSDGNPESYLAIVSGDIDHIGYRTLDHAY